MADQEEPASHKRKASPSHSEDDVEPKRARVESAIESATDDGPNGNKVEPADTKNVSNPKHENGADVVDGTNRVKQTESETDRPRSSRHRQEDDDTADKQSSNGRRPSITGGTGRKDFSQEEKKRGKRLFGGLLSTLNQKASSTHQKKRLEIERRQQEKAKQQKVEDDRYRSAKLAKLQGIRKIEQVKFDEQVMETRHARLKAMASCLRTRSEPAIYYRPWELTEAQKETIKRQEEEAQETIAREAKEFQMRKGKRLEELGASGTPRPDASVGDDPQSAQDTDQLPAPKNLNVKDHEEAGAGDELVQDQEDAVLY